MAAAAAAGDYDDSERRLENDDNNDSVESSKETQQKQQSTSKSTSSKQPRVGVADYFAILGVGENLIWKHANKQKSDSAAPSGGVEDATRDGDTQSASSEQQPANGNSPNGKETTTDEANNNNNNSAIPEEDDAMLMERFYREIVDCDIVTVMPTNRSLGRVVTGSNPNLPSQYQQQFADQSMSAASFVSTNHHPHGISTVLSSPNSSWDAGSSSILHTSSGIGGGGGEGDVGDTSAMNETEIEPPELEGWTVIKQTRPASLYNNCIPPPVDIVIASSSSKPVWTKGQVWDANLNPITGLTSDLQTLQIQSNLQEQEQELIRRQQGQQRHGHREYVHPSHGAPLQHLKRRVQSSFQTRQQQWLSSSASPQKSAHGGSALQQQQHQQYPDQPQFYLSYKRRTPDEPNLPGIADIELKYVRVHKSIVTASTTSLITGWSNKLQQKIETADSRPMSETGTGASSSSVSGVAAATFLRMAEAGKNAVSHRLNNNSNNAGSGRNSISQTPSSPAGAGGMMIGQKTDAGNEAGDSQVVALETLIGLPTGYTEWIIPSTFSKVRLPIHPTGDGWDSSNNNGSHTPTAVVRAAATTRYHNKVNRYGQSNGQNDDDVGLSESFGIETIDKTPSRAQRERQWRDKMHPKLMETSDPSVMDVVATSQKDGIQSQYHNHQQLGGVSSFGLSSIGRSGSADYEVVGDNDSNTNDANEFYFVPVLAVRRQRIGEEERFLEDPALVEIAVSFMNEQGQAVLPTDDMMFDDGDDDDGDETGVVGLLDKTKWNQSGFNGGLQSTDSGTEDGLHSPPPISRMQHQSSNFVGAACLLVRRNVPMGFCDAAFTTGVLDRFPYKNYKGLPLPEEELPMFCYPTGCRLYRAKFCDAPLPQYYGFVVKNERGDSIYVSCVSFMEPLTVRKKEQLARLSEKRRRVSLPHNKFCARRFRHRQQQRLQNQNGQQDAFRGSEVDDVHFTNREYHGSSYDNPLLTGFDEMTTFENKTICLVSRFPYWTAFRRFLSHIHSISGSSSELPLERCISHLLLSVPVPKPGGPSILIPLPTFNIPMVLSTPPLKDLPLVDLPYERLVACLDVPTIVTLVLGFLALERKVIVMSTRPSLVLDVCELLRSLLFPFEVAAPYVPRLTEPFMSCLEFPGAIFVGIHDDGTPDGLAATVRQQMPEDSTIVELDTGKIDCTGDRVTVLNSTWGAIPPGPRSNLVSEIETLCRDASIVPGQEPLDSLTDAAFDASAPSHLVEDDIPLGDEEKEPLDDRAIRDAFLRFFCSVLAGYERFLVVPDVDFLISGNEWFNSNDFLSSASEEKAPFLGALVSTQLFQSFIQRRTESSDVHLLLFDECLQEYLSSSVPYGRLGGDVETVRDKESGKSHLVYSLLVDQCAADSHVLVSNDRSFDGDSRGPGSETENSSVNQMNKSVVSEVTERLMMGTEFVINASGDWVTMPKTKDIPYGTRFIYCVDGNPTFPDRLDQRLYSPREPETWLVEMDTAPTPMLTRSSKEIEDADRRRKFSTSYRGLQSQRKCLWQLPKLMGSHFLGTWLMCMPALVSHPYLSHGQQTRYILRAFGALRLLRSKQKIIPDEAAYRALIVACGRTKTDRRAELVNLFGLLRSDGINPSAVTLGQYTKALAEGYSKRAIVDKEQDPSDPMIDIQTVVPRQNPEVLFQFLDSNLGMLEESGRRWRQRPSNDRGNGASVKAIDPNSSTIVDGLQNSRHKKRTQNKSWLPVMMTSSYLPTRSENASDGSVRKDDVELLALWSRTTTCEACGYVPLDEEVQGGWDAIYGGEHDLHGAINCPRCGSFVIPKLAYKQMTVDEASAVEAETGTGTVGDGVENADFGSLPPQIRPSIEEDTSLPLVTYLSPSSLRLALEQLVDEHGENILERERLRSVDQEVFYNFVWYCARFSLPLSLPVATDGNAKSKSFIAIIGWDKTVALRGCYSCGRVLSSLLDVDTAEDTAINSNSGGGSTSFESIESLGEFPLLSKFNLSGYYSSVWDHPDLSEILVTLVEACDKRDFRPVVECVLKCNKRRQEKFGSAALESATSGSEVGSSYITPTPSDSDGKSSALSAGQNAIELDCYRTIVYLAKYQCTSAFHAFFPATLKPCKGYHFWCPIAPVPIFDLLFREAVQRVRTKSATSTPTTCIPVVHDVSDVALGFRCVFGHLL